MARVPTATDLWFLPLGGSGEIGMNLNLYGHDGEWLMVDLGITFGDRLGIDVITPDPIFIEEQKEKLVGIVITHAHEDHVGAVPYLWHRLRAPVYATPFTAKILREKLKEIPWGNQVPIHEIPLSGTVDIGKFNVEFVTLTHSIPEPNALAITTPLGTVLHTGDWKIDPVPLIGEETDHARLTELGDKGVLALVCDSTNVFSPGSSGSEDSVRKELVDLIGAHPHNRVVVACFASNLARLETAAVAAETHGRKAALVGRSLYRMEEAARQNGYLKNAPPFISERDAMSLPKEQVMFITTGSQGEPRSALARIAQSQHPIVKLDEGDVVFFSSRMIPGNERSISALQNRLVQDGLCVITSHEEDIHVSGHPSRDELKQMYEWTRPEILIPVHGEARHLYEHAAYGLECGIPQALVPENGTLIQLAPGVPRIIDEVDVGRLGYDGNRLIPMNSLSLRDRSRLSVQGVIFASVFVTEDGLMAQVPEITLLGVADTREEEEAIIGDMIAAVRTTLQNEFRNEKEILEALRSGLRKVVSTRLSKKPLTEVHLITV